MINREHIKKTFKTYTDAYDSTDEKVKLKIDHTYRVADLCEKIAQSENLSQEDIDLAWLLGMLHDVGRFEQLRRFGTFIDAESIDHAALGADILFKEGHIEDYITLGDFADYINTEDIADSIGTEDITEDIDTADIVDDKVKSIIEQAVRFHSAYRVPNELDDRTKIFCDILRDADKIDILKVNVEVPLEEIYNTTTEELRNSVVTKEVMESFYEHHAVLRSLKKSQVDHVVGHISLVYELVYPESVRIMKKQGYLDKLLNFESYNKTTLEQFMELRAEMEKYLADRV